MRPERNRGPSAFVLQVANTRPDCIASRCEQVHSKTSSRFHAVYPHHNIFTLRRGPAHKKLLNRNGVSLTTETLLINSFQAYAVIASMEKAGFSLSSPPFNRGRLLPPPPVDRSCVVWTSTEHLRRTSPWTITVSRAVFHRWCQACSVTPGKRRTT
jgi:hypothetical protein